MTRGAADLLWRYLSKVLLGFLGYCDGRFCDGRQGDCDGSVCDGEFVVEVFEYSTVGVLRVL